MQIFRMVATALSMACLAMPVLAQEQTVDAFDRGQYRQSEGTGNPIESFAGNLNYMAGRGIVVSGNPAIRGEYRNFFAFDLSTYSGSTFGSAVLSLYNPKYGDPFTTDFNPYNYGGFVQTDPTGNAYPYETYELHQVTTDASTLLSGHAGISGYTDLGDGPVFGTYNASLTDNGSFIRIALNAQGLAALNQAVGGTFILGGSVSTIEAGKGSQTVFGWSNNPDMKLTQLTVTPVPEPETYAMLLLGLSLIGSIARRRVRNQ